MIDELKTEIKGKVSAAFLSWRDENQAGRSPLSMSKMGACSREVAYLAAGYEPTDPQVQDEARAAALGTWNHRGFLPRLRKVLSRSRTEVPVILTVPGFDIPGQLDLWWRRRAGDGVIDVKTVREYGLERIRTYGPPYRHEFQVDGYAMALRQTKQANVTWTAIIYIDRSTGETEIVVREFGWDQAAKVLDRMEDVARWQVDPTLAPRDEDGPGLSWLCDNCQFLRECWGPNARPGSSESLALDPWETDLIAASLDAYEAARVERRDADARMARARAEVAAAPPGKYGRLRLGWSRSKSISVTHGDTD